MRSCDCGPRPYLALLRLPGSQAAMRVRAGCATREAARKPARDGARKPADREGL